jgi:hypothetical protein
VSSVTASFKRGYVGGRWLRLGDPGDEALGPMVLPDLVLVDGEAFGRIPEPGGCVRRSTARPASSRVAYTRMNLHLFAIIGKLMLILAYEGAHW